MRSQQIRPVIERCFLWLCCFLASISTAETEDARATQTDAKEAAAGPRLYVESTKADLGTCLHLEPLHHIFELANVGDETLEIQRTRASCGCVSELLSAKTLAPGATGQLKVGYKRTGQRMRRGSQSYTLSMFTNDPVRPRVDFMIEVTLANPVETFPEELDFGELAAGEVVTKRLDIYSYEKAIPLKILSIESSSPFITIHELPIEQSDLRITLPYEVVFAPKHSLGRFREHITFETDNAEMPIVELPVRATIPFPVEATPSMIYFGLVQTHDKYVKEVQLVPKSPEAPDIAKVACADPRVRVKLDNAASGRKRRMTATLSPGRQGGTVKTHVDVLDAADAKLCEVALHAVVRQSRQGLGILGLRPWQTALLAVAAGAVALASWRRFRRRREKVSAMAE